MKKLIKIVSIGVGCFIFFMLSMFVGMGIAAKAITEKTSIDHENKQLVIKLTDEEWEEGEFEIEVINTDD